MIFAVSLLCLFRCFNTSAQRKQASKQASKRFSADRLTYRERQKSLAVARRCRASFRVFPLNLYATGRKQPTTKARGRQELPERDIVQTTVGRCGKMTD